MGTAVEAGITIGIAYGPAPPYIAETGGPPTAAARRDAPLG